MAGKLEKELRAVVEEIIGSDSRKKVIVAGPGTGKTWLFRRLLEGQKGDRDDFLVLTFINNLKDDLERDLGEVAQVYTFHGYCRRLLHKKATLRGGLTEDFHYFPPLGSLIKRDWELLHSKEAPHFIGLMRDLKTGKETSFYLRRADYYDAVAFDDSVFRVYERFVKFPREVEGYRLVLVDEYQDFNHLEAAFISSLAAINAAVIVGDDDQALYSQLRGSNAKFIRELYKGGEYEPFTLPFCMRCTAPIVGAVEDIVSHARESGKLNGRIAKPYLFYPPVKDADSEQYPRIKLVQTTIQSRRANYFGRYIEKEIQQIPEGEIRDAWEKNFPVVLVIGPKQYLRQIREYLEGVGHSCQIAESDGLEIKPEDGLQLLRENSSDNLGWRIMLEANQPPFLTDVIKISVSEKNPLIRLIPDSYRQKILSEAQQTSPLDEPISQEPQEASEPTLSIRLASYEGSKGLSAQHVFVVGLHEGDLPRNANNITDLEICKFLVALTRTRKQCHLIYTIRWSGQRKTASTFLSWIKRERLTRIKVNKKYWDFV